MTAILGISAFYHDSAAALVIDGDIVAAVQEERFTREKYDPRFPSQAIASCLYDDIELILKEEVFLFDPDYVVLMFFNGNDFRDTYLGLNKYTINDDETSQWNEGNAEEKIPSEYRLASAPILKTSLRNHLATYRALANLKHSVVTSSSAKVDESILFNDFKVDKLFTSYTFWSQSAYPSIAVEAKNVSLQTLDRIRSYLQEKHVHLIIVAIPYREQVYVKSLSGSEYNVEYPQKYVEMYAKSYDVPYLDLLPVLRDYVRETKKELYVRGDPHFNNEGHSILGQVIADWFLSVRGTEGSVANFER